MKIDELLQERKKRKKRPTMVPLWYGFPYGGTQAAVVEPPAGGEGGGIGESVVDEWLLPKGWVMTYVKTLDHDNRIYHLTKLMDDTVYATAGSRETNNKNVSEWYFYTPAPTKIQSQVLVLREDAHDMLRMKWWVINQLIQANLLEPAALKGVVRKP